MVAPPSEVALVPLAKGANVLDTNSEAGRIVRDTVRITAEQPGYIRMIWGVPKERPDLMIMVVDWEDISFHRAFENQPWFGGMMDEFNKIVGGPLTLMHGIFEPLFGDKSPAAKMKHLTVNFLLAYFPTAAVDEKVEMQLSWAEEDAAALLPSAKSYTSSWSIQKVIDEPREGKGEERGWVAMIGWESDEAQKEASSAVSQSVEWASAAKGEVEVYTVHFVWGPPPLHT